MFQRVFWVVRAPSRRTQHGEQGRGNFTQESRVCLCPAALVPREQGQSKFGVFSQWSILRSGRIPPKGNCLLQGNWDKPDQEQPPHLSAVHKYSFPSHPLSRSADFTSPAVHWQPGKPRWPLPGTPGQGWGARSSDRLCRAVSQSGSRSLPGAAVAVQV